MIAIMPSTDKQNLKQALQQRDSFKSKVATDSPNVSVWLTLVIACVLEIIWIIAPWGSALGFFSLLACIFMFGISLIVGLVLITKGEHYLRAAGILLGSTFLFPFLIWLLLDALQLDLLLH